MRLLIARLTNPSVRSVSLALNSDSDVADIATDLDSCIRLLRRGGYDLVLLVVSLGRPRGRDLLARLRQEAAQLPMVVVTEVVRDEVALDELAHDDGLVKLADPRQGALTEAGGDRSTDGDDADPPQGEIELDADNETLRRGSRAVGLSHAEARIFARLWQSRGRIVSADELLSAIYGEAPPPPSRVLPVFLFKLRKKLAQISLEDLIETSVGRGFMIRGELAGGSPDQSPEDPSSEHEKLPDT
jgi:DNA-binding response OmpR family regulator